MQHFVAISAILFGLPRLSVAQPQRTTFSALPRGATSQDSKDALASPQSLFLLARQTEPRQSSGAGPSFPVAAIAGPIIALALIIGLGVTWALKRKRASRPTSIAPPTLRTGSISPSTSAGESGFQTVRQTSAPTSQPSSEVPTRTRLWRAFVASFVVHPPGGPVQVHTGAPTRAGANREGDRHRGYRGDHRRLRRTDSGQSIRTVPEYASEVHADEVMLYKAADDPLLSTGEWERGTGRQPSLTASIRNSLSRSLRRTFRSPSASRSRPPRSRTADSRSRQPHEAEEQELQITISREDGPGTAAEGQATEVEAFYIPDYDSLYPSQIDLALPEAAATPVETPDTSRRGSWQATSRQSLLPRVSRAPMRAAGDDLSEASNLVAMPTGGNAEAPASPPSTRHRASLTDATSRPGLVGDSTADLRLIQSGPVLSSQSASSLHPHSSDRYPQGNLRNTVFHLRSTGQLTPQQVDFMNSAESLGRYGISLTGTGTSTPREYHERGRSSPGFFASHGPTEDLGGPPPPGYGGAALALPDVFMSADTPMPASIVLRTPETASPRAQVTSQGPSDSASTSRTGTPVRGLTSGTRSSLTSPKLLRSLHNSLLSLYGELHEEQVLLERLWYKSHAQFRGAKWFKSIDAVRRGLRRALGQQDGHLKRGGKRKQRHVSQAGHETQLLHVLDANAELYYSLFDAPVPVAQTSLAALPKLSSPLAGPGASSFSQQIKHTLNVLRLLYLFSAIQSGSRNAFAILRAHLNTPPAPTFAPLATVLLAVASRVEAYCEKALFGNERSEKLKMPVEAAEEKRVGLVEWYERERRSLPSSSADLVAGKGNACSLDINCCPAPLQQLLQSRTGDCVSAEEEAKLLTVMPLKLRRPPGAVLGEVKSETKVRGTKRKTLGLSLSGDADVDADADADAVEGGAGLDADGLPPVPKKRKGLWEELSMDALGRGDGGGDDDDDDDDLGVRV
ncbi:hypothetical protein BCV69DRAFT_280178 [Microstroma glucosiphilum]|uniref:Nucleolus and neural progenitor protein-like N-terminal domain-containing protein n=1 Tax=Pseudomicrostroma glucosiphilum TaxID=1684307 RepID=A0A316UM86_9BASI|nr:hypothetical protein BCV69DRAFT_280178 [Pseudomicrostroma glucosiphilum]PWN24285.1 hypothetical protein BCV69DRAFT_280178 [Pseudomicrostroma glucosiphilum]